MGGVPPLGYQARDRKLVIVESAAEIELVPQHSDRAEFGIAAKNEAHGVASRAASRSRAVRST